MHTGKWTTVYLRLFQGEAEVVSGVALYLSVGYANTDLLHCLGDT